jgi:DNA-directed DNA polymerase III PolC
MFTHLHTHSFFSFTSATIPVASLPELAKKAGMTALALTDTNNVSGSIEFYLASKHAGIKPILGVELKTRHEKVILIAKNNDGYSEICSTVTQVLDAIPQIKPKLTLEDVDEKPVTVIADSKYHPLAPFLKSLTENVFIASSSTTVLSALAPQAKNVFMELIPAERSKWKALRALYRDHKLPIICTNDVYLHTASDYDFHKILRAIGTNTTMGNTPTSELADATQWFTNEAEYRRMASNIGEECFRNVAQITEACCVEFDLKRPKFTTFDTPDPFALLRSLAREGFDRRYPTPSRAHFERFENELTVIESRGATSYFLVTHDMIQYSKSQGYPHLGRGSGANSLIAFCLGISNIDPIANNLLFERFLNPERESPPDFDIDYSSNDRPHIQNYLLDKYGRDKSALLSTHQTYRDRGAIRAVGKALGFSDTEIKLQEMEVSRMLRLAPKENRSEQRQSLLSKSHPDITNWMLWSARIQGYPSHLSVHAGGVIITDKAIAHYTALQNAPSQMPISHLDMYSAEELNMPKLDVLATRGLGTYRDTMKLVEERYGQRPPIEEDPTTAFSDEATKEIMRKGRTKGCFYIESPAMIALLRKTKCDSFSLLTAVSSVIRPGVSQSGMMQEFIRRHRNPESFTHIHPMLERLLKDTYGVMVYQEDVLNVVHHCAGLSLGEADLFRRAMSGKARSQERIADMQDKFIQGCLKNGFTLTITQDIWRQILSFIGYSFCKAHSASYAVLSFQKAWLKVHYPAEFLCSVLNNFGGFYSHQEYINEAKHLDVHVCLPDVNRSLIRHTVEDARTIRLGFSAFQSVSQKSLDSLLQNREISGAYQSIEDFAMRSGVTQEDGNILISLGACSSITPFRSIAGLKFRLLSRRTNSKSGQRELDFPQEILTHATSYLSDPDPLTIFNRERKYFGYSVTNHPCDFLKAYRNVATVSSLDLKKFVGKRVTIIGHRSSSKRVQTKTGKPILMLNVSDHDEMMDVVVWNEQYLKYDSALSTGSAFKIVGKVTESFDVCSIEAIAIERLEFTLPIGESLGASTTMTVSKCA